MVRCIYIFALLFSILLSLNACSAVLVSTLGTNYDSELTRGKTSRDEMHKHFGQPISSQTYSSPMDPKDIYATTLCSDYWDFGKHDDPTPYKQISGSEVFSVKGRVIILRDHWTGYVYLDFMTLCFAEIITTPAIILDWLYQLPIKKELTVYYRTDDTFAGGEIRYSDPHGLKHLIRLPWWEDEENGFITHTPDCFKK